MGTNDLKNGGSRYEVEKFIRHEQYDKPEFANDIALIRVKGEIQFNDKVQPIKYSEKFINADTYLYMFGWGKLKVSLNAGFFGVDKIRNSLSPLLKRTWGDGRIAYKCY